MHGTALQRANEFVKKHGSPGDLVYDFGSYDVCGTFRPLVEAAGATYVGIDTAAGPNVDYVVPSWHGVLLKPADIILCSSLIEHVEEPEAVLGTALSSLRPGGKFLLIAPCVWEYHPMGDVGDYYRFLPESLASLCKRAGFEVGAFGKEVYISNPAELSDSWVEASRRE